MCEEKLTPQQEEALKEAAGVASGYERYRTNDLEQKPKHDCPDGIAAGYEKQHEEEFEDTQQ